MTYIVFKCPKCGEEIKIEAGGDPGNHQTVTCDRVPKSSADAIEGVVVECDSHYGCSSRFSIVRRASVVSMGLMLED